jgi:putative redox protein
MDCTVKWMGSDAGMSFVAETGSGHMVAMDGAPEAGGRNLAPRPMELLLAGTGGCTAFDVVMILKKGRHAVTACEVSLSAERAENDPKVFTRIHFHYRLKGQQLKPEAVARAIELSKEKYCSASIMLAQSAEITADFEIMET